MDASVTETYMGEWKNDKRSGFGISERSDGLKYEGEWYANKKYGYGVTTFSSGEKEEGKYKNNVLITSNKKKHLFLMRSAKFRERIDAAVNAAQRASKIALQKADIAISRTATARGKAEQADICAAHARDDSEVAQAVAKQYAPDFKQPGLERLRARYRDKFSDSAYSSQKDSSLSNSIPNQLPNQINSQDPVMHNKIPNQLPNQLPNHNEGIYNQSERNNPGNPGNSIVQNSNPTTSNDYSVAGRSNSVSQHEDLANASTAAAAAAALRRNSRRVSGDRPYLGSIQQSTSIDYFDHYKRPPSRDSSVDRYARAAGRLGSVSAAPRQPSIDKVPSPDTPDRSSRYVDSTVTFLSLSYKVLSKIQETLPIKKLRLYIPEGISGYI